jgi:uracil-DNA glycosylase family 4
MKNPQKSYEYLLETLKFLEDLGVNESIGDHPIPLNKGLWSPLAHHAYGPSPLPLPPKKQQDRDNQKTRLEDLLRNIKSLTDLKKALENFEGCSLKLTAQQMVFGDGNPSSPIMMVGEAPGAEEDKQGKPFVGLSGQLLDRMLATIGLNRTNVYITNIVPWRHPGNRQPTPEEVSLCLPFLEKHIELLQPKIIVCVGGTAAKGLLATSQSMNTLRGQWRKYGNFENPIDVMVMFHPAYLLRSPGQKKMAWMDLLMLKERLHHGNLQNL